MREKGGGELVPPPQYHLLPLACGDEAVEEQAGVILEGVTIMHKLMLSR